MKTKPKILIVRLSSLGDIILISPVIKNIKLARPDCEIILLTKPQYAKAIDNNPLVDKVISFTGIGETVKQIKQEKIDCLIDLHSTIRTHIIGFLSAPPKIVRYNKDSLARRIFVNFKIPDCSLQKHTVNRYLETLKKLDIPIVSKTPQINDWSLVCEKNKEANSKSKRICVLQTAFLGDCALTLPLIEKIKDYDKGSNLTVITRPETVQVFKSSKSVDSIIVDNKKSSKFFLPEFFALIKKIKSQKFDIAIIPHRSLRSALIAFLAGIPLRIGFSESAGKIFLNKVVPFSWLLHDAERNFTLLLPLVNDTSLPQAKINVS